MQVGASRTHTGPHVHQLLFSSISDRALLAASDYMLLLKIIFKRTGKRVGPGVA